MTCYHPLFGFRSKVPNPSGKSGLVFRYGERAGESTAVPCGQCIGCRLDRAKEWAIRCQHENQLHEVSCFLTLTYRDEDLPPGGSLRPRDLELFMKRLRERMPLDPTAKRKRRRVSFFASGEYGGRFGRPHYHVLLFGYDFPDKRWHTNTEKGAPLWTSALLEELWRLGQCTIGEVTFESAKYAAGYVLDKVTGERAKDWYRVVDQATGEVVDRVPEFCRMSRRPALGKEWFKRFHRTVYRDDSVVMSGKECPPPRYYDRLLEEVDSALLERIKKARVERAAKFEPEQHFTRRAAREKVAKARFKR